MPLFTSLVDLKCHEGFRCISAVDIFGRSHDGDYTGYVTGQTTPARFRGAYEDGCPARGQMTPAGDCRDFGKGPVGFCFSKDRYESGPDSPCKDPSMCMCVKNADNGTAVQSAKDSLAKQEVSNKASESVQGIELQTKKFWIQPPPDCAECAVHNCSRDACNTCGNCEYGTKLIMGRQSKGCFDRDFGESRKERILSKEGRKYLFKGMEGRDGVQKEEKLVVIPHYPLWDPGDARMNGEPGGAEDEPSHLLRFPYQSRREPLSREAWIESYKKAAPRIQRTLDVAVENVKEWGPKANDIECMQDIEGRLTKINLFRRECRKHQDLGMSLAPYTPFKSDVPDVKPDGTLTGAFHKVKCSMGGQGMCENLNCYSDDVDLLKGIAQIGERERTCRAAMGLLVHEEETNGPVGEEAEVSARTGGRLEVALPPPGVTFEEGAAHPASMPVDIGLALWSAAGAVAAAKWNFFPTATASNCERSQCHPGVARKGRRTAMALEVLGDFLRTEGVGALR